MKQTSDGLIEMFAARGLREFERGGERLSAMRLTAKQAAWLFDTFRCEVGQTPSAHGHRFASGICALGAWDATEWNGGSASVVIRPL